MGSLHKEMVWLDGEPKTPPIPSEVRIEAGYLFRFVQTGILLSLPHSRPMPSIGKNCHELRINSSSGIWRFFYFIDSDAVVSIGSFCKKTAKTPKREIELCKSRLKSYINLKGGSNE
jgi:phage-related protein